jgi:hypothetical protein
MTIPILSRCALASWWQGQTSRHRASSFQMGVDLMGLQEMLHQGPTDLVPGDLVSISWSGRCWSSWPLLLPLGGCLGSVPGVNELCQFKVHLSWDLGSRVKGVQRSDSRPEWS